MMKVPLSVPSTQPVHIRRAESNPESGRQQTAQQSNRDLPHTSPPEVPAGATGVTLESGTWNPEDAEDLNSEDEFDILADLRKHYVPSTTSQEMEEDSAAMADLEFEY